MEHAYRMKGKGGPAINDGALSSAARQQPIRRSDAGSGTGAERGRGQRRICIISRPEVETAATFAPVVNRGHRSTPALRRCCDGTLDDQLDDLFARESDRLPIWAHTTPVILQKRMKRLTGRGHLCRRERGDQIKLNNIEAITKTLLMAFLMEKGIHPQYSIRSASW